jgi:hypothetical protein
MLVAFFLALLSFNKLNIMFAVFAPYQDMMYHLLDSFCLSYCITIASFWGFCLRHIFMERRFESETLFPRLFAWSMEHEMLVTLIAFKGKLYFDDKRLMM